MANVPETTSSAWRRMSIPSRGCLAVFAAVVLLGYVVQTAEADAAIAGCPSEALAAAVAAAPSEKHITVQYLDATGNRVTVYGDPEDGTSLGRGDNVKLRDMVDGSTTNHGNIIAIHTGNQIETIAWYALYPSTGDATNAKLEEAFLPKVTQIDQYGFSSSSLHTVSMPQMSDVTKLSDKAFLGCSSLATVVIKDITGGLASIFGEAVLVIEPPASCEPNAACSTITCNAGSTQNVTAVGELCAGLACDPAGADHALCCQACTNTDGGATFDAGACTIATCATAGWSPNDDNTACEACTNTDGGATFDAGACTIATCTTAGWSPNGGNTLCEEHAFCSTITCTAGYTERSDAASTHCAGLTCNNSTDFDTCCEEDADMGPGAVVTPILLMQASAATLCLLGGSYGLQQAK